MFKRKRETGSSGSDVHRASFGSKSGFGGKPMAPPKKGGGFKPQHQTSSSSSTEKLNPFERLQQRSKFNVLGQKLKGTQRANGQARSKAIQKRKESLLVELQNAGKKNQFIDQRFGEGDDSLTVEDKFLKRFQKERIAKSGKFSLEDDDEELTHMGTALSQLDNGDFNDEYDEDDEDEEDEEAKKGQLTAAQVADHFGGGALGTKGGKQFGSAYLAAAAAAASSESSDPNRARTKEEVMREVIAKSKLFKLERQQDKQQNDTLINNLDEQFGDIRRLMQFRPSRHDTPMSELPQPDEYDRKARELLFDPKVRATDRTKTEEEIAKEEMEKLKELEEKRLKRMQGVFDDDEDEDSDDDKRKGKKRKTNKGRRATDDDLDEDLEIEEVKPDIDWDQILFSAEKEAAGSDDDDDEEDDDDEDDEDDEDDDGEDEDESDNGSDLDEGDVFDFSDEDGDAEDGEEVEDDEDDDDESGSKSKQKSSKKSVQVNALSKTEKIEAAKKEIPYLFEAPNDLQELLELFEGRSVDERSLIIQRIRACHHISLNPGNRAKLQRLYYLLWNYLANVCEEYNPNADLKASIASASSCTTSEPESKQLKSALKGSTSSTTVSSSPASSSASSSSATSSSATTIDSLAGVLRTFDSLSTHIFEMSDAAPGLSGKVAREKLAAMQKATFDAISLSPAGSSASCFPDGHSLLLLRLLGQLFSVSDARHPVITPCMLFMAQCLTQVPLRGGRDAAAALFLVNTLLAYVLDSKRYIPEVIGFLKDLLLREFNISSSLSSSSSSVSSTSSSSSSSSSTKGIWSSLSSLNASSISSASSLQLPLASLFLPSNDDEFFASPKFLCSSLNTTLSLINRYAQMYSLLPSLPEQFGTILDTLKQIVEKKLLPKKCAVLTEVFTSTIANLELKISNCIKNRRPMEMRKFRPIAIRTLAPKFDENYFPGKDTDADRDRAEHKKLKKKVKSEKRGAMRELRKDAAFLALEQRRQQELKAADKDKQRRATLTWLQSEAAEAKPQKRFTK